MTVAHRERPVQIDTLAEELRGLFSETADALAYETKFIKRKRKLSGSTFAQALVFTWLTNPEASYPQLQQMLSGCGSQMSAQGLEQRFTSEAADFLLYLLYAAMQVAIQADALTTELLTRFSGVYLQDGSVISLPPELEGIYQGCGGNTEDSGKSALRVQVRLDLNTGAVLGPWLQEARACEQKGVSSFEENPLPDQALRVCDVKYFPFEKMQQMTKQQQYFLTGARADLVLQDRHGVNYDLVQFLGKHEQEKVIDEWVTIGKKKRTRQRVRLLAFRVSEETEQRRREQVNQQTKLRAKGSRRDVRVGHKHQRPSKDGTHRHRPSAKRVKLAGWTMFLTNVVEEHLSPFEARALMRARWQIELVWRLWKERGQVDIWRSEKPMRILCEVYAKLLAMLVQHWLTIVGCWSEPHRSLVKASLAVRLFAPVIALTLSGPVSLCDALWITTGAMTGAKLNTRKNRPSTSRLLEDPMLAAGFAGQP